MSVTSVVASENGVQIVYRESGNGDTWDFWWEVQVNGHPVSGTMFPFLARWRMSWELRKKRRQI